MKRNIILLVPLLMISLSSSSQIIDTIANWDGINVEWSVSAASGQTAENPQQQGINTSDYCFEVTTSEGGYDLIFTDFPEPVNFEAFPKYRLKILAPPTGGSVLLKFENSDNTSWVEIEKTPVPGQWDELEFDFSGTTATDYVRMVIFFDFLGTSPGNLWYLDDVLRISDGQPGLTSNLPIVIINTDGIPIPDEPKITGTMGIIDNGPGNLNNQFDPPNDYNGFIGIEIRGQSSQMFPKKSYGFETRDEEGENLNVPLLGLPEENDWVLYAPYSDKSMLRNFITFYMGSKLDPYCTRMVFCEVIVNNDYVGVYILMEKIKRDDNRVNIATLNPGDISGDELTGGYIVKVDKIDDDFIYGQDGWLSTPDPPYPNAMEITFQYNYPDAEDLAPQQSEYIKEYITMAENTLTGSDFADPDDGYNHYFNTGSFVDQMILNEVSKEVDRYRYSTFFYKEKDSDGGKLFAGPAWDFNLGYSNVDYWPPGVLYTGWLYSMVEPVPWGIMFWWKKLMQDPYFRDLFHTRWTQLRQDEFSDINLHMAIDSLVAHIYEAQERNYERWPILGEYVWPNYDWAGNDYEDEVEFFESWFFNRLDWIDVNIPGNMLIPEAQLSGTYPELTLVLSDDYFSREILKKKYFVLNNAPAGMEIDTVIYQNASKAILYLTGSSNQQATISVLIKNKVINSFKDLLSNETYTGTGPDESISVIEVFTKGKTIVLRCDEPHLLGDQITIYNLAGQQVETLYPERIPINSMSTKLNPGIYLCVIDHNNDLISLKLIVR